MAPSAFPRFLGVLPLSQWGSSLACSPLTLSHRLRQDMKCYDRGDECQRVRDRWEAVGRKVEQVSEDRRARTIVTIAAIVS